MALFISKLFVFFFSRSYYGMSFFPPLDFLKILELEAFFFLFRKQISLFSTAIILCVDSWNPTKKQDLEKNCPAQEESSPFIPEAPGDYPISSRRRHRLQTSHTPPAVSPQPLCSHTPPPGGHSAGRPPPPLGLSLVSIPLNSDSPSSLMPILCPSCWFQIPLFSCQYHSPFSFHSPPCPQALITSLKIILRITRLSLTSLLSLGPACKLPAGHPHLGAALTWEL